MRTNLYGEIGDVGAFNVRRVRDDQVERVAQALKPVTLCHTGAVRQPVSFGIFARDSTGRLLKVDAKACRLRAFTQQGQKQRTASGPQIEDTEAGVLANAKRLKCRTDDGL